ncbi:hypothetical protein [Fusobacterium perfoetens]|uniref:hypothetical protein n=1 Tax=Fusobacterium perfoetens TaxID=852 RepID=UPI000489EED1|nr:hypothetical protein [Fusobacterium perfoetens]
MKKIIALGSLILTLCSCSFLEPKTEVGAYGMEAAALALSPIIYPIVKVKEEFKFQVEQSQEEKERKQGLTTVPGKSKSQGYFSSDWFMGNFYRNEYVIYDIFSDKSGFITERKGYLPSGQLIVHEKFRRRKKVYEKVYYPNGKQYYLVDHDNSQYISYDINGNLTKNLTGKEKLTREYNGETLIKESYSKGEMGYWKNYYDTGAPKGVEVTNMILEDQKLFSEAEKTLKDWNEVYEEVRKSEKTKYNGKYRIYSPNGDIYADFNFKNGYAIGEQKQYYWNSKKLFSKFIYVNGNLEKIIYYFKNGKIKEIHDNNSYKSYNLAGQLIGEGNSKGRKEYYNGKLIVFRPKTSDWADDETKYYLDGKLKAQMQFVDNDSRIRVLTYYHYNGKRKEEYISTIYPDQLSIYREYYMNGKMKYEEIKNSNIYRKIIRFYDINGNLLKEKNQKF